MPYDLTEPLVIGISTRALFDLEKENAIFEKDGARAFADYQKEHEGDILQPGSAFELVKAFLRINELSEDKKDWLKSLLHRGIVRMLVFVCSIPSKNSAWTSADAF